MLPGSSGLYQLADTHEFLVFAAHFLYEVSLFIMKKPIFKPISANK